MSGTKTQSRLLNGAKSKIFAKISAALVACIFLLGTGLPVFALPSENNYAPIGLTSKSYTVSGHLTLYQLVDDLGEVYNLDLNNGNYELSIAPSSGYVTAVYKGILTASRVYSFTNWDGTDPERTVFGNYTRRDQFTIGTISGQNAQRVSAETIESSANLNNHSTSKIRQETSSLVDIDTYGVFDSQFLGSNLTLGVQVEVFATYRVPVTSTNFNTVIDALSTQTVAVTAGTSSSCTVNAFASDLNTLELLEEMDAYLDSISRYQQSTYGAVLNAISVMQTSNAHLSSIISYLAQCSSYLSDILADTGSIYGEVSAIYNMLDDYLYNASASTAAAAIESENAALQEENASMDAAIESLLPDVESEIAMLEEDTEFNRMGTRRQPFLFWRRVSEYLLSYDNLGLAATGLIVVSLACFLVYLLRL